VLQWAKDGKIPPSEQVLVGQVVENSKSPDVPFIVTVEYATKNPESRRYWHKKPDPKNLSFPFLFVYGPQELEFLKLDKEGSTGEAENPHNVHRRHTTKNGKKFQTTCRGESRANGMNTLLPGLDELPGIDIVDITEIIEDETGHAPRIGMKLAGQEKDVIFIVDRLERGWAQRLECSQLAFNHDSHLVLPDKGLAVILLALRKSHDTKRHLVLCGHTDASGKDEHNEELAANRCINVLALLEGKRRPWAESSLANYKKLPQAKKTKDTDYLDKWLPESTSRAYGGLEAWQEIFDWYEEKLATLLAKEPDLPPPLKDLREGLKWVDAKRKTVSCAEQYLKVNPKSSMSREQLDTLSSWDDNATGEKQKTKQEEVNEELKVETNRRIEFLWFEPDRLPWEKGDEPDNDEEAREEIYGAGGWETWDYQSNDGPFTFDQIDCPPALAIAPPPGDVLFVIDLSGSMEASFATGQLPRGSTEKSRWMVLQAHLDATLESLRREPRKFGILRFGTRVEENVDFFKLNGLDSDRLVEASDIEAARNWVRGQKPFTGDLGKTNTYGALEQALKVDELEAIVFLSDGIPSTGTSTKAAEILGMVEQEKPKKLQIDTYGFGQNLQVEGDPLSGFLVKLAEDNGGEFYDLNRIISLD
jgi:hypothetical protein